MKYAILVISFMLVGCATPRHQDLIDRYKAEAMCTDLKGCPSRSMSAQRLETEQIRHELRVLDHGTGYGRSNSSLYRRY